MRPRNPLTFAVGKGRLSAHHWVRFPSQKRITGHIALIGRAPASTTVSTQREVAGSSPAVSAVAVACAVTRTHHPCEAVCKRKNLGVPPLRPSFIGSSVLSDAVQRRTMSHKTRYKYRYIYRGPNVFNTEWSGVPGLGDRALEVHRLAGSTPVTSTEMAQWRVISPSPGSRDSLVAVSLT